MDTLSAKEIAFSLKELLQIGTPVDECLKKVARSLELAEYDEKTRIDMRKAVGDCAVSLLSAYGASAELCAKCVTPMSLNENLWLFLKKGASPMTCLEKLNGCSVKEHESLRLLVHYGVEPDELIRKCRRSGVTISCHASISLLLRFGANPSLLMNVMTGDAIAESLDMLLEHGARPDECAKRMKLRDVRHLSEKLISHGGDRRRIAGLIT